MSNAMTYLSESEGNSCVRNLFFYQASTKARDYGRETSALLPHITGGGFTLKVVR